MAEIAPHKALIQKGVFPRGGSELEMALNLASGSFPRPREPVTISHEGSIPKLATEYLKDAGVDSDIISALFDSAGVWKFPPDLDLNPYTFAGSPRALQERVLAVTRPIYIAAQASLAHINPFGYNDHGPSHIERVSSNAIHLAELANLPEASGRRALLAALFHDLGNLTNRDNHSMESPLIAEMVFPQVLSDMTQWRTVRRAIELHNSAVYRPMMYKLSLNNSANRLEGMRKLFGVEGLVTLIADKTDFHRERVNDKALSAVQFQKHKSSHVNFFFETESFKLEHERGEVVWNLRFRPDVVDHELSRFEGLSEASSRHDGRRKGFAPEDFRNAYENQGIRYFDTATDLFWKMAKDICLRTAEASLALFSGQDGSPLVDRVILRLEDAGGLGFSPTAREFNFSRDSLIQDCFAIEKLYGKKTTSA